MQPTATNRGTATTLVRQMVFPSHAKSVSLARRLVQKALTRWGYKTDAVDALALITSELAANAVQHAGTSDSLFHVRLTADDRQLHIEVSDTASEPLRPAPAGPDAEHGRGLHLVAALSDDHGCRPLVPTGKTVWARFLAARLNAAPPQPCAQQKEGTP